MSPCGNSSGNIVLVGLSGAGKTSCAQILAGLLDLNVLDTDEVIQKNEGRTVAAIFTDNGEAHFRALERALIENLLQVKLSGTVISVGGGLPAQADNASLLKELGFTIFLDAQPTTIAARLAADLSRDHSLRPLLTGGRDCKVEKKSQIKNENLLATLEQQLAGRRKYYEEAHLVINTEGKSADEICREIQTIIVNNSS